MKQDVDTTIASRNSTIKSGIGTSDLVVQTQKEMSFSRDYSSILKQYKLDFKLEQNYYQVGEIGWTQGWIIDISSVIHQLTDLFRIVVPILVEEGVPFKIVQDFLKASSILNGEQGNAHLGKMISVFPRDEQQAVKLAQELISQTSHFKGPEILTDRRLRGVIYTRYGAGNSVLRTNEMGAQEKCIYDINGNLVPDPYHVPFAMPVAVEWPFLSIAPPKLAKMETVLQDKYKPMDVLKKDVKGYVKKGLWLKKWWHVKWCVIKEGKMCMISDTSGRDISDRLKWQFDLHQALNGIVPLPAVIDLFEENENHYLVMEYIKGSSLQSEVPEIFSCMIWSDLSETSQRKLINYILQIIEIIERMHENGFIHRDITPPNFLITKTGKLYMIDLELTYNEQLNKSAAPFRLGTPGFTSPEQMNAMPPKPSEDIYAIGALMVFIFTGLLPDKFSVGENGILRSQLLFFNPNSDLVNLISNCFDEDPQKRPSLKELKSVILQLKEKSNSADGSLTAAAPTAISKNCLSNIVNNAIHGLGRTDLQNKAGLWHSFSLQREIFESSQVQLPTVYENFHNGLSGVLYLLARANRVGFTIEPCRESFERNRNFIESDHHRLLLELPGGLYLGTAGLAIALAEGVASGLIPYSQEYIENIRRFLGNEDIDGCGLVKGVAGQCMAILKVVSLIDDKFLVALLEQKVTHLLEQQEKDGSWIALTDDERIPLKFTGWNHGSAGILCFLLEYIRKKPFDERIKQTIYSGLDWMLQQRIVKKGSVRWRLNNKTKRSSSNFRDGSAGIILLLIKAFEFSGEKQFKVMAEECLRSYPRHFISNDITLETGIAGLGEIYLEAATCFDNQEWEEEANWISNFIGHHFLQQKDGSVYWLADGVRAPTAGLMTGCSGVIHFLMRCAKPGILSHPLLCE